MVICLHVLQARSLCLFLLFVFYLHNEDYFMLERPGHIHQNVYCIVCSQIRISKKQIALLIMREGSICQYQEDRNIIWLLNDAEYVIKFIQRINLNCF